MPVRSALERAPAPLIDPSGEAVEAGPEAITLVEVPLGQRVVVAGDLLLPVEATPSSEALAADLAATLSRWQGPGVVVLAGNVFAAPAGTPGLGAEEVRRALDAHPQLTEALRSFAGEGERRLLLLPGWRDPEVGSDPSIVTELYALGAEVVPAVDLDLRTGVGTRRVAIRSGNPTPGAGCLEGCPEGRRPWLEGIDRLEDPASATRFVTSRTLYRRLSRFVWVPPLLAVVVALVVHLSPVFRGMEHLVKRASGPHHLLLRAYSASWHDRLAFTIVAIAVSEILLGLSVAVLSRRIWRQHAGPQPMAPAGAPQGPVPDGAHAGSSGMLVHGVDALDEARRVTEGGGGGLIVGGRLRAELTHLGPGFFACPGGTTEVVREEQGRLGLPPVFHHHRQLSWIELESGADLHVRLLLADADLPHATRFERLVSTHAAMKGHRAGLHPALAAGWPRGGSWPPAPDVKVHGSRLRLVRRLAATAIFAAGLLDLLMAVVRPTTSHVHFVTDYLPLGVAQAAGALVVLAGISLMMLARGVLRGQRRAWFVAVVVLGISLVLHLLHAASVVGIVLAALVLVLLLVERAAFGARTDPVSQRSALVTLLVGVLVTVAAATTVIEVTANVHHEHLPGWPVVVWGAVGRLAGYHAVALPEATDDWISPGLLGLGLALAVVVLFLFTRPVVDRRLSAGRSGGRRVAEHRARDIVRRHGNGTLDYFALRDDKHWFFHRDSVVAYAVYGTTCLVSPDPIGPESERRHVWDAFRRFCDRNGWGVTVMAAGEDWLPLYRDSGMRHLYLGDEGVVDLQNFSLQGGKMKGLRQAVNRIQRYGYRIEFFDPTRIPAELAEPLRQLCTLTRRGEAERGFSMTLSRLFDPRDTGLLAAVAFGPDGGPVALCQFVPAAGIGGYSLDLMRRDIGEHPNGLIDFVLCETIEHLRKQGHRGLSLNFATLRAMLDEDNGDGLPQRVERWVLRRMSGLFPIESLWRFNSKYQPDWLPRYLVFDSPERVPPSVVACLRAESLSEVPVVGRFLTPAGARKG